MVFSTFQFSGIFSKTAGQQTAARLQLRIGRRGMSGKTTDLSGPEVRKLLDHKKIPRWIQRGILFW